MKALGIETSCDETAVAIVSSDKEILSNNIFSQVDEHKPYGGVVPELAARSHINTIDSLVRDSLRDANTKFSDIDIIAVTSGPGLIGGVIVGLMVAKAISSVLKLPLIGVNHLEAHALTSRLTNNLEFPFLLLLISGGHCQFLAVEDIGKYQKLGGTIDDSLGESFDKVSKMLGLGYPGGVIVEQYASKAVEKEKFIFPRPMKNRKGCDFSFSGLKTAVKRKINLIDNITEDDIANVCSSFQECIADILENRIVNAIKIFQTKYPNAKNFVVSGGVAANQFLNKKMRKVVESYGFTLVSPPINLCTDNAAMVAWAGIERFKKGFVDSLDIIPKPRWPLEELE